MRSRRNTVMVVRSPMMVAAVLVVMSLGSGFVTASDGQSGPSDDARVLIETAFRRYTNDWPRSLTFVQQTIRFRSDGSSDTATWYESYQAPGCLRIDFAPLSDHSMLLFANDTQYVYRNDSLVSSHRYLHPLLLLGFDLYFLSPDETLSRLRELGFNLEIVRKDQWLDRPAIVVGALADDTTSAQFWMDEERLVFVRMIVPASGHTQEVLFNKYRRLNGGWIAPEVVARVDGRLVMKELYTDIRVRPSFDVHFFSPSLWGTARHWHQ